MAIAHVVGCAVTSTDPNSVTSTAMDTTGANFGVASCSEWDAYSDPLTISDNFGNTWIPLTAVSIHNPSLGQQQQLFYCVNPIVGAGHVVTISRFQISGSACFDFFSGVAEGTPFESEGGYALDFGNSTLTLGPISPAEDGCLIYTGLTNPAADATITDGFSAPSGVVPTPDYYGEGSSYQIQTTARSVSPTWSYPGADGLAATYAVFRPALADPTLVGWWKCYDSTGSTLLDSSGNGNDATLQGGASLVPGPVQPNGNVLNLPGVPGDFAQTGSPMPAVTTAMTLALWINRSELARGALFTKNNGTDWNFDLLISNSGSDNFLRLFCGGMTPSVADSTTAIADLNAWHHVAVTYDGADVVFYVDAVAAGTTPATGTLTALSDQVVMIGREGNFGEGPDGYFKGKMFDVRYYNQALSGPQILDIYNQNIIAPPPIITSVVPAIGPTTGANVIAINGTGFSNPPRGVTLDGVDALSFTWLSSSLLQVTVPPHAAGAVDIIVTNLDYQIGEADAAYTYFNTAPVAWWPCDEGSGMTAHDVISGNNATLLNGAAFVTGQQGSAVQVVKASQQEAATSLQGPNITNDITIMMWINRSSQVRGGLLAKTNGTTWNYDFLIGASPDKLTFYSDNLIPNQSTSGGTVADTGVWHHVAVTHQLNGNTIFYIDGVNAGGSGQVNAMNVSGGELVHIGSEADPGDIPDDFFDGLFYDVRIYDRVLTPEEIAMIAQSPGSTHRQMGIGLGLMLR